MRDRLIIHDLVAACRVGVFEVERATPQQIWIDLDLTINAAKAAAHDDVEDAIDYAKLATTVREYAQEKPYRLLETLAEEIAAVILGRFRTPRVRVRLKKRALPGIDYAAVEVTRRASVGRNVAKDRSVSQRHTAVTGKRHRVA